MGVLFIVIMLRAAGHMPEEGQEEEEAQGHGEGMSIEREGHASLAYRPWSVGMC